jgi:hypothetical protein
VVVRDVAEAMAVDPGLVSFAAEAPTGVVSPTAALMAQSADAVFGARYVRMGAAVVYTCLCLEGCGCACGFLHVYVNEDVHVHVHVLVQCRDVHVCLCMCARVCCCGCVCVTV